MKKTKQARRKPAAKIWHIFRFVERFELRTDYNKCKKGPLVFVKQYVGSGTEPEAIAYAKQMAELMEQPNRRYLHSIFMDLLSDAANQDQVHRGYLFNGRLKPATITDIATMLREPVGEARAAIKELEKVGLIERVELPEFPDEPADPQPQEPAGKKKPKGRGRTAKGHSGSSAGKRRKSPKKSGEFRRALKKGEGKEQAESGTRKEEGKEETNPNPKPKAKQSKNTGEKGQGKAQAQSPNPEPEGTEAGGRDRCLRERPPNSTNLAEFRVKGLLGATSAHAFAQAIFRGLFGRDPNPGMQFDNAETGAFASLWEKAAKSRLSWEARNVLWDRSVERAFKMGQQSRAGKKYKKNVRALWSSEFNKRLAAACLAESSTGPPKVASG